MAVKTQRGATGRLLNRELSTLEYSDRLLDLASDDSLPLLERVKMCRFVSSNLDEFFMVRVAGLLGQAAAGLAVRSVDGLTPLAALAAIRERVLELAAQARLLLGLAHGTGLVALAGLGLSLRKGPVVVLGPVHQQDLVAANDDAARRPDARYAVFARRFHAVCHSPRVRSARSRSRSTSRPAATAAAGSRSARRRSRSWATTASWCSPSTSWSFFAAAT